MHQRCPFAAPLTVGRAACTHALEVVRRGGAEFDCASPGPHARCRALFDRLKAVGLAAFGAEDDLTTLPHSVLVKVQTGGLAGLARLLGDDPAAPIADIDALVERAGSRFGGVADIPVAGLAADIRDCALDRRGRRRG